MIAILSDIAALTLTLALPGHHLALTDIARYGSASTPMLNTSSSLQRSRYIRLVRWLEEIGQNG